jgi:hypothetical protein
LEKSKESKEQKEDVNQGNQIINKDRTKERDVEKMIGAKTS